MNPLDQFFAAVANAAQRLGIQSIAVAAKDPASGEVRFVASKTAPGDLRETIATKWGFGDASEAHVASHLDGG